MQWRLCAKWGLDIWLAVQAAGRRCGRYSPTWAQCMGACGCVSGPLQFTFLEHTSHYWHPPIWLTSRLPILYSVCGCINRHLFDYMAKFTVFLYGYMTIISRSCALITISIPSYWYTWQWFVQECLWSWRIPVCQCLLFPLWTWTDFCGLRHQILVMWWALCTIALWNCDVVNWFLP